MMTRDVTDDRDHTKYNNIFKANENTRRPKNTMGSASRLSSKKIINLSPTYKVFLLNRVLYVNFIVDLLYVQYNIVFVHSLPNNPKVSSRRYMKSANDCRTLGCADPDVR